MIKRKESGNWDSIAGLQKLRRLWLLGTLWELLTGLGLGVGGQGSGGGA